jgi:hypothetical protein
MRTGLNKPQRCLYFALCREAVAIRMHGRQTWTKSEEENERHEITREALGVHKSSTIFTHLDFDRVVAKLKSIIRPHDFDAQFDALRQARKRALWVVNDLVRQCRKAGAISPNVPDINFVNGVIEQIENGVDPNLPGDAWDRELTRDRPNRSIDQLTVPELRKVMDALRAIIKRHRAPGCATSARKTRVYHLHPV